MNRLMDRLARFYHRVLVWCLERRWTVIVGSVAIFVRSLFLLKGVRKEFVAAPGSEPVSRRRFTRRWVRRWSFTDAAFREAEKFLHDRAEVDGYYIAHRRFPRRSGEPGQYVRRAQGSRRIARFKRRSRIARRQQEFMAFARDNFSKIKGVTRATVLDLSLQGFTAQRGFPVTFSVQGPEWDKLADYSAKIMEKMKTSGLMTDVDTDYNPNMPEVKIIPDRRTAAQPRRDGARVSPTTSARSSEACRSRKYTDASGHRDDIRVKLLDNDNKQPKDIAKDLGAQYLRTRWFRLGDVVTTEGQAFASDDRRYNRERAITVFANIAPGKSQSDAMDFCVQAGKEILPDGYHIVPVGKLAGVSGILSELDGRADSRNFRRLHGSGRAVQQLHSSVHGVTCASVQRDGRVYRSLGYWNFAEHLLDDRSAAADGDREEELDSARGFHEPSQDRGPRSSRSACWRHVRFVCVRF